MDILNISHEGVPSSGNNFKNFEEQPSGPHAIEFLETCRPIAARTSSPSSKQYWLNIGPI